MILSFKLMLERLFLNSGAEVQSSHAFALWSTIALLVLICFLAGWACRRFVTPIILKLVENTTTKLDDYLLNKPVLNAVWHFLPGLVFLILVPLCFSEGSDAHLLKIMISGTQIYLTLSGCMLITAFLSNISTFTTEQEAAERHHIVVIVQFLKIVVYIFCLVIIIALLLGRNPLGMVAGLGAAMTVLLFVFKDTILGLVAGVQLSANKMLKTGDWITISDLGINGIVERMSLTTVKVRNFDNTVSTVPPYTLVSQSFQNWDGMFGRDARRVKRIICIDAQSVKELNKNELDNLKRKKLITASELKQIEEGEVQAVNLTIFRHYVERKLKGNDRVLSDEKWQWIMARITETGPHGIALELWFYLNETRFVAYENLAGTIVEAFIAVLPQFSLRLFQAPSSYDFASLASHCNEKVD